MNRLAAAVCLWLGACSAAPSPAPPYAARPVVALARWQVEIGGEVVGEVVHYEIRDPQGPVRFYRVEDRQGRWLGHASENGRFSRRVPFREDEEDLGVLSMRTGVARLFDADAPATLSPMPLDADLRRER